MKKALVLFLCVIIGIQSFAYAEGLSNHHRTLLDILAKMSTAEDGIYEEAYYHEELNAFVLTYKQDDPAEELIEHDPSFAEDLAKNCADHMCKYYMDWVDMFNIDVDIIIRHIAQDGDFLFCMKNGIMYGKDIVEEGKIETKSKKELIELYLQLMESMFDGEGEVVFGCKYDEKQNEILMVYTTLTLTGHDLKYEKGKAFKKQLDKEIRGSIYDPIMEQFDKAGISDVSLRIRFITPDRVTITEIYNGNIIK